MTLPFRKYQGLGNDFILLDGRTGTLPSFAGEPAQQLCDRHFGIGADGLILALPPQAGGDVRMQIFNADGSEAEMCGNGIRCFARFLADLDAAPVGKSWQVETAAGRIVPQLLEGDLVSVDMGRPFLEPSAIPTSIAAGNPLADQELEVAGERLWVAAVGMGNPHAVVQVLDLEQLDFERLGPALEQHPAFPARANVHFVQVIAADRLRLRVWERGAGPTLACGTGACASLVATHLRGACGREASLELPGGPLQIRWDDNDHLQMAGPAVHVFSGVLADNSEASAGASDAGYQQALALLDNLSLDQMVNLANNSLEERNRRRISGR